RRKWGQRRASAADSPAGEGACARGGRDACSKRSGQLRSALHQQLGQRYIRRANNRAAQAANALVWTASDFNQGYLSRRIALVAFSPRLTRRLATAIVDLSHCATCHDADALHFGLSLSPQLQLRMCSRAYSLARDHIIDL